MQEPFGLPNRPTKHHIELLPGAVPPKGRIYRMSPGELEELRRQLETLTSKGWIRPSTSEFGAPVLFVPKGSGEFRMCIDYRGLNKITRKSTEPLPRIDDLLDMVQGCTIFSKVDLKYGYHQIEMAEEDVHKTAFKTRYGTYEYLVMPFGLCNAPATFQTEMHRIFRPYLDKFMVVYLDDILVFSKTTREHVEHLALVLQSLRDSQYKINKEKSSFGVPSMIYLGHALTHAPILKLPDPSLSFILTTDASQYGIRAVLWQDDGNGLRPFEFMSKKIKTQKLQDSTYEKELYALVSAMKHWKHFLLGRHFKIFSDHSTLQWLKSQGELNDKLARYIQFIDLFDFELKHKKGCYNKVVDTLSRRRDSFALISSTHSFGEEVCQTITRLLPQDPTYGPIVRNLQADLNSEPGYAMSSDLLYTYSRGEERLCIPEDQQLRTLLMSECHDARGHFGFLKSYAALSQRFFWKEMQSVMLRYVETYELCQRNKVQRKPPLGLLKPLPIPFGPARSVSIDFTDLGKTTPHGMRQVMVCVDRFSKYAEFIPLPEVARVPAVRAAFSESGKSTMPYSKAQEEQTAAILRDRKEKKELLRQAKMKVIAEEQAAKKKKLEEEMKRLLQEEEERMRAAEEEEIEEEERPEEEPLRRRRLGEGGESSGTKEDDPWVEKKISEWVANLTLGEDEEAMLYIPQEEKEAAIKEIEATSDPLERQAIENEKRLDWKLRLAREKKRRTEEANRIAREVESLQTCRQEVEAQPDIQAKLDKILGSIELLGRAWTEHHQSVRGQEMGLHSIRSGFKEFARDVMTHAGTEVRKLKEGAEKLCASTIEGAKVVAAAEIEGRPRKEPIKLTFSDSYGGKKDENFDNWEASINTYVYLQHIAPEEQVLVAFHALKDEAASFARSLARAADCEHNMVAYSKLTPLHQFLKLLGERFVDVT
ncbi:hypothetical protein CBR_g6398 [Chara braunii]|uniref:Reverse transcriptase domain-containing protein n=1 Tax=Chara braunii TaxID=69332 RepID=A0A388KJQ7_CHABU|nr:hypothetical protein CBR_g6398 [Chara braunii]|eukprot:GBG70269.1 hypothetical protein CBR_g6398 [Chara braunii]